MRKMRRLGKRKKRKNKDPSYKSWLRSTDARLSSLNKCSKSRKNKRNAKRSRKRSMPLRLSKRLSSHSKESDRSVSRLSSEQELKSWQQLKRSVLRKGDSKLLSGLLEHLPVLSSKECMRRSWRKIRLPRSKSNLL